MAHARGRASGRLVLAGVALPQPAAERRQRDGTAGLAHAAVPDCHTAVGPDGREAAAEQRQDVERGRAEAGPAHWPGGAGAGTVQQAHEAAVGDGHGADGGRAGGAGGGAVGLGLPMAMPGERPPLGSAGLQQAGVRPGCCAARTGEGGARFARHQAGGARGPPSRAVLGEAPTGHHGLAGRVVLAGPAPRRQDTGAPRQVWPHDALVVGPPRAGRGRGLQQGVGRAALRRAEAGAERLRDRQGAQAVRPRERVGEVGLKPRRRWRLLALGAGAGATRRLAAGWSRTGWARREARALGAAAAVVEGAEHLPGCGGEESAPGMRAPKRCRWPAGWSWSQALPAGGEARGGRCLPLVGEGEREQRGVAVGVPQGALHQAGGHAGVEQMGGVGLAQGRESAPCGGQAGLVCGGAEGALDPGAAQRGSGRRPVGVSAPSGGQAPGLMTLGLPGGTQPREGSGGQGAGALCGALAAVDRALEALTVPIGELEAEGGMESRRPKRETVVQETWGWQGGAAARRRRPSSP